MTRLFTMTDFQNGLRPSSTRDGRKIDFINYYPVMHGFVSVLKDGQAHTYNKEGRWRDNEVSNKDLMIESPDEVKEEWRNIYPDGATCWGYKTRAEAEKTALNHRTHLAHIKFNLTDLTITGTIEKV